MREAKMKDKRLPQLGQIGSDHRVRPQVRVLAEGDVTNPAADILTPDPEAGEVCHQLGQLAAFGVNFGCGLHYCHSLSVPLQAPRVNDEKVA